MGDSDSESDSQFSVTADSVQDGNMNITIEDGFEMAEDVFNQGEAVEISSHNESDNEEEGEASGLKMPERKRKLPAPVWKCAEKVEGGGKCNMCGKIYRCTGGNTSGIINHMLTQHPAKPEVKVLMMEMNNKKQKLKLKTQEKQKKANKQPSILSFSTKRGLMDQRKQKKIEESLVKMTVMMNRPFSDVDNPHFRQLLYAAEPNFICPSAKKHTSKFDEMAVEVKKSLKKEIIKDVTEAGHKTIIVTSDHGTSGDRLMTKENAVTVARTTEDFVIKKDIVKMLVCKEVQTGKQIKTEVKGALEEGAGYDESWLVDWVTDGEAKQLNATEPSNHPEVKMKIAHRGKCVDHTLELGSEETNNQCPNTKIPVHKVRALVNYLKDSSKARVFFHNIMLEAGVTPLSMIQGTANRWFFKYSEVRRALQLKETINTFFDTYDIPDTLIKIEDEDWDMLLVYENAMREIVDAAKVLEGELYPTASSVIPFLDTIFDSLQELSEQVKGVAAKHYIGTLLTNLQSNRRFPDGYKDKSPYNVLTLLDPRYLDAFFEEHHTAKALEDLYIDHIYDDVKDEAPLSPPAPTLEEEPEAQDKVGRRLAALLARKTAGEVARPATGINTVKGKLKEEMSRLLKMRGAVAKKDNPMNFWRANHKSFPLLAMFWRAHSAFPATSTSAERAYSMDGLILQPCRMSLLPDRTGNMIVCRDYWMSRTPTQSFKLCSVCPPPPSQKAS